MNLLVLRSQRREELTRPGDFVVGESWGWLAVVEVKLISSGVVNLVENGLEIEQSVGVRGSQRYRDYGQPSRKPIDQKPASGRSLARLTMTE